MIQTQWVKFLKSFEKPNKITFFARFIYSICKICMGLRWRSYAKVNKISHILA